VIGSRRRLIRWLRRLMRWLCKGIFSWVVYKENAYWREGMMELDYVRPDNRYFYGLELCSRSS
jgi:hypothetical protein